MTYSAGFFLCEWTQLECEKKITCPTKLLKFLEKENEVCNYKYVKIIVFWLLVDGAVLSQGGMCFHYYRKNLYFRNSRWTTVKTRHVYCKTLLSDSFKIISVSSVCQKNKMNNKIP
jgi:hypothetical protein